MENLAKELEVLIKNVEKVIVGKEESIKLLVVGLLTNSHILIEDVPGVGKTMLALALAKSIKARFQRIQFTPDILPTDITGGFIYNQKNQEFEFKKGPIFTNIALADEINRTTPRTQSALLECMQEYKVSIDGNTFILPKPFMVIATQNPIEYHGTYPLPEAQIDRFLMKINMGYLSEDEEVKVISSQKKQHPIDALTPVLTLERIVEIQEIIKQVEISPKILNYIVKIVSATRKKEEIKLGGSARTSIAFMQASRVWAILEGRNYVIPDDIINLSQWILGHRLVLNPLTKMGKLTVKELINDLIKNIPIP